MLKSLESKILAIAVILMVILYIVRPESGAKKELKEKEKQHAHAIDSIKRLQTMQADSTEFYKKAEQRAIQARILAEQERDQATQQRKAAQRKYESIKHRNYSNAQLDSIISVLYPH